VATSSEHVVWTDDYEAAVYLLSKQTSSSPLRAMRTGRQRLTALTVAAAAAPSTPTRTSPLLTTSAKEVMFLPECVCLSVCLLTGLLKKTTDRILTKLNGMVRHNPGNSRLDFGGNRDLESDPGIF